MTNYRIIQSQYASIRTGTTGSMYTLSHCNTGNGARQEAGD